MKIISMPNNEKYDNNYDRIFGKKKKKASQRSPDEYPDGNFPCRCVGPALGERLCPCAIMHAQRNRERG